MAVNLEDVIASMKTRDHTDSHRKLAPLQVAEDAMVIDTTCIGIQQVLDVLINRIENQA